MHYKLYSLVDITHTGQYRLESGKEKQRYQEQNFNTVIQTLGIRSNIYYDHGPALLNVRGSLVGFRHHEIIQVWRFDWHTEQDNLYLLDDDPVGLLKKDFNLVPYIQGLNETIEQNYPVFITNPDHGNIVFHLNQSITGDK